jgi:head-tail adaptor
MRASTFIRTGDLDTPLVVERKATPADPEYVAPDATYGTESTVWVPLVRQRDNPSIGVTFWANKQDALPSRSESVLQGAVTARNQTRFRMRWRDDIDSSMRIVTLPGGEIYQIIGGPAVLGRRQFIELMCERIGSLVNPWRVLIEGGDFVVMEQGGRVLLEQGGAFKTEGGGVVELEQGGGLLTEV